MRVDIDGETRLFFDTVGSQHDPARPALAERLTVVCLHGGPGYDHMTLRPDLDALAEIAHLVYLDHRGNGRSDGDDPARWNLDTWIDDIARFCAALDIQRPVILGQSFGGFVALGVAARHPDLVRALIISSSAARMRLDRSLAAFARLGGPDAHAAARAFFEHPTPDTLDDYRRVCLPVYFATPANPEHADRIIRRDDVSLHFWRDEIHRFDLTPELPRIDCPTLVIGGTRDPITPPDDQRDIAAAIGGARLEIFDDAGHGAVRDRHDAVHASIRRFLTSLLPE